MTGINDISVGFENWSQVYLPDEKKNAITAECRSHLAKRLTTLIECISDFGFGRGQVLLGLLETNFTEYGKAVLTNVAGIISGADAEICLGTLRRQIMPEIINSILPPPGNSSSFAPQGLWEELLDEAYSTARKNASEMRNIEIDAGAFRSQYTLRLRRERFRKAFRQKLESALAQLIRDVGRGVRQRLSPTVSELRAQARQRRRTQVNSEQRIFSDPKLLDRDWSNDLSGICLSFEGKIAVPEAWRTRKNLHTWTEVAQVIETDRALRSRVHKYVRRRLSGARAIAEAERDAKAG